MQRRLRRMSTCAAAFAAVAAVVAVAVTVPAAPAGASPATSATPVPLHIGQVTAQDIASQRNSETDTVVEPDVAVSPLNRDVAIAAAHDSRFRDGGALDISYAWTTNGGATWQHAPVQGITTATGGPYDRASDPVLAFGPDGTAYLSVLLFDATTCPTAVAVLRSNDGGQTWGTPSYVNQSSTCDFSDDKNWIVVDSSPSSPHYGRIYQFWTPFLPNGSPQVVSWSDDKGASWSPFVNVTPNDHSTQNSQPMIERDGTIVDAYYDYGIGGHVPDAVPAGSPEAHGRTATSRTSATITPAAINAFGPIVVSRSTDGGQSWSEIGEVTTEGGGYASGVRCCLFAADIDPLTQVLYVAWEGSGPNNTDPVFLASSTDGSAWTAPLHISPNDIGGVQEVNVDVAARGGNVYVAYGTRTSSKVNGGFVQQYLSASSDRGRTFGPALPIGPVSALQYAAQAGGYFPGDYIGEAVTNGRLYMVWAVSSRPPIGSSSRFHQVIEGATLSTTS